VGDSLRDLQAAARPEPIRSSCSPAKAQKHAPTGKLPEGPSLSGSRRGGVRAVSMIFLRSLAFLIAQILFTPPYAIIALATFPLPRLARYRVISGWSHAMMWLSKNVLGIHYRVIGAENLPRNPAVILSKHQSAWETLAFQVIFPPQVLVLKRELLWIPFFGWGLALTSPIRHRPQQRSPRAQAHGGAGPGAASRKDSGSPSSRKALGCSPARGAGTILVEHGSP